jgi:hypothetical protein
MSRSTALIVASRIGSRVGLAQQRYSTGRLLVLAMGCAKCADTTMGITDNRSELGLQRKVQGAVSRAD